LILKNSIVGKEDSQRSSKWLAIAALYLKRFGQYSKMNFDIKLIISG